MIRIALHRNSHRRHPLARILFAALGLVLLGVLSVFALLIGGAVLGGWLLRRYVRSLRGECPTVAPQGATAVIDGEFRVVAPARSRALPH